MLPLGPLQSGPRVPGSQMMTKCFAIRRQIVVSYSLICDQICTNGSPIHNTYFYKKTKHAALTWLAVASQMLYFSVSTKII